MAHTIVDSGIQFLNTIFKSNQEKNLIDSEENQPAIKIAKKVLGLFFIYGIPIIWNSSADFLHKGSGSDSAALNSSFKESSLNKIDRTGTNNGR